MFMVLLAFEAKCAGSAEAEQYSKPVLTEGVVSKHLSSSAFCLKRQLIRRYDPWRWMLKPH